jgi:hypothetical protein
LTMFSMLESGPEFGTRTPNEILCMTCSYFLLTASLLRQFRKVELPQK